MTIFSQKHSRDVKFLRKSVVWVSAQSDASGWQTIPVTRNSNFFPHENFIPPSLYSSQKFLYLDLSHLPPFLAFEIQKHGSRNNFSPNVCSKYLFGSFNRLVCLSRPRSRTNQDLSIVRKKFVYFADLFPVPRRTLRNINHRDGREILGKTCHSPSRFSYDVAEEMHAYLPGGIVAFEASMNYTYE